MPAAIDLITLDDLKTDLRVQTVAADETSWDDTLQRIISGDSDAIATSCNRTLVAETETTKKLDGDGTVLLLLKWPIISVGAVVNDTTTVVETTNWIKRLKRGELLLTDGTVWTNGPEKITITYRHGYEDIPPAIQEAAMLWARKKYFDIKDDRVGVSSRSTADGDSISYASTVISKGVPDEVEALIASHRVYQSGRWST